jgi:hypothetical protein
MCSQPRHVLHGILTGIALGNACSCHGMLRAPDRHTAVSARATIQARRREVVVACVTWARNFVIRIGVTQVNLSHERAGGAQPGAAARWHTRPLDLAHPKRSRSVPSSSRRSSTTQMMSSLPASQRQRTAADRRVHTTTTHHHPSAASSAASCCEGGGTDARWAPDAGGRRPFTPRAASARSLPLCLTFAASSPAPAPFPAPARAGLQSVKCHAPRSQPASQSVHSAQLLVDSCACSTRRRNGPGKA